MAYLGQQPITRGEVDFVLGRAPQADLPPLTFAAAQTAIQLVATQRQALQTLREQKLAADRDQVARWIQSRAFLPPGTTIDEMVREAARTHGIEEATYWELMAFRLSWKRYLARHLTLDNIARHFANQPARFDGTRFRIMRMSVAVPAGMSSRREQAVEQLGTVRSELRKSDIDPSALRQLASEHGWELSPETWVEGTGSLDPAAVTALLPLKVGEVTEPIHTAGGVHLIRLLDKQPGELQLDEVRDEVRTHLLVYLLDYLASWSAEQLPLKAVP
jgi:hypothetical protein